MNLEKYCIYIYMSQQILIFVNIEVFIVQVVSAADVVLEIVDARDPLGTRCKQVLESAQDLGKKLVVVLNKTDLVPAEIVRDWLAYFRGRLGTPALPFKASTQQAGSRIGHKKMNKCKKDTEKAISLCVGAELIMTLLANYCRNDKMKTSIVVGVVGKVIVKYKSYSS